MTYKIYELKLKPISPWITDLTADTIFGHLCWQIKYSFWDEVLENFLEEMAEKPIFTISDILPADRLPRPLTEFDGQNVIFGTDTDSKIYLKRKKKYNKEITYISEDGLNKFSSYNSEKIKSIINNRDFEKENNRKWTYFFERIENKNIVNRLAWTTLENGIYSQWINEFNENSRNKVVRILLKTSKQLENYKILDKELDFFDLIKTVFEIWYWKKKSSWKWQFKVWKWKEKSLWNEQGDNILLLSSFVPSEEDSTKWNYKLFTKFPKLGEEFSIEWNNFYKKPLVMIQSGAAFRNNWSWYVGKMIKDVDFLNKWIYHYAYGFTIEF